MGKKTGDPGVSDTLGSRRSAQVSSNSVIFINYRREAALRRVMAGKGTSYFGCPAHRGILLGPFPPGYLVVATLELFHIKFLRCPSAKKEGALSVLGVLHLWIGQMWVVVLGRTPQNEPNSANIDRS